jgi:site-specific DNA-adenine methylase
MVFMGSKRKYKKYIVPIINKYIKENNITKFYDVFCGGCNLSDEIICDKIICNDLSPTLIALHKQA